MVTLELTMTDDRVAVLTMNRPDRANTQTVEMFHDYHRAALTLRDSGAHTVMTDLTGPP